MLANVCDINFIYLKKKKKLSLFIFQSFIQAVYQYAMVGVAVMVHLPQFEKLCTRQHVFCGAKGDLGWCTITKKSE